MAARRKRGIPVPQNPVSVDPPGKLREFSGGFQPRETTLTKPTSSSDPKVLPVVRPRTKPIITNGVQR